MSNPARTWNPQPPRPPWGVRPPPLKQAGLGRPIRQAPPPAEATLPLAQGPGDDARPLVSAGARVLTGEPVARAGDGTLSHSPVTGTVLAIAERAVPAPAPRQALCLVIRRDRPDEMHPGCRPRAASDLAPQEIRERVAYGGIRGLGGALFPTAAKLVPGASMRALIINGVECEPWITCDEMLIRERADSVVAGAVIMMRALGAEQAAIAVKADMPEARTALLSALAAHGEERIGVAVVTAKYPAGGERQLIELLTGAEVPSGGRPRDIGYVVHNAGTATAVAELFATGRPLISRIVTVTGRGVAEPGNFEVRIGTPISELIALAGGYRDDPQRLIMGGPMMGFSLPEDGLPVTKATNCIVAATSAELAPSHPEMPCIRCGECIQACPARLLPQEMLAAIRQGDARRLDQLGLADCIECGCCDYVCPSYLRLTARFAAARAPRHETAPVAAGSGP